MASEAPQVDVLLLAGVGGEPTLTTVTGLMQQTDRRWRLFALTPDPTALTRALEGPTAPKGSATDPRLVMLEHTGTARANAWNRALKEADAPFLMVLEPGDALEPTALEKLLGAAVRSRLGGAVGGFAVSGEDAKTTGYRWLPSEEDIGLPELYMGEPAPGSVSIVSREVAFGGGASGGGGAGGRFAAGLPDFVRLDAALRTADSGRGWAGVHEVLGSVRVRHDRAARDFTASAQTAAAVVRRSFRRAAAAGFERAGMELSESFEQEAVARRTVAVAMLAAVVDPEPRKTKATEILREHLPATGENAEGLDPDIGAGAAVWAACEQMGFALSPDAGTGSGETAWARSVGQCWQRVVSEKRAPRSFVDDARDALARRLAGADVIAQRLLDASGDGPVVVAGGAWRALARLMADTASRAGRNVTLLLEEPPPHWAQLGAPGGGAVRLGTLSGGDPANAAGALFVVSEDPDEERALLGRFGPRGDVHRWTSASTALAREMGEALEGVMP